MPEGLGREAGCQVLDAGGWSIRAGGDGMKFSLLNYGSDNHFPFFSN